jgi:sugar lactone lactonase YvrE
LDIADDGGLANRRVWADAVADGTCADAEGAIWTGVGGFGDKLVGRAAKAAKCSRKCTCACPASAACSAARTARAQFMLAADWRYRTVRRQHHRPTEGYAPVSY